MEDMRANPQLQEEYENTFDSEEKISHSLKISKDSFTIDIGVVEFSSLLISEPTKKGRKETYLGLATSVAEMGILSPIHVMITESYATWVKEHGDDKDFEGYKYIILDGFRRVWSGVKTNLTRCNAVIWNFKGKDKGTELATVLSLILNKIQKHSWGEIWYLYQLLEVQSNLTPGTLEYLLQLDSGDAMKLKDIMLCDYDDIKEELLSNKKNITQAYNMLQKYRKEEDQLMKDDQTGISDVEQAKGVVEKANNDYSLSNEDVKEILEMEDNLDGLSESDFDESLSGIGDYERQNTGERHPLDPALKAETLVRDEYTCQCCGAGSEMSMMSRLAILQSHHKISVSNNGPDSPENIITVCQVCHTLIHVLLKNGMKFGMSKEQFDKMSVAGQTQHKNIMKVARVDWEAGKRLGKNKEDFRKDNMNSSKFRMPGADLGENRKALEGYKR